MVFAAPPPPPTLSPLSVRAPDAASAVPLLARGGDPAPHGWQTHVVRRGDTLWDLARAHHTTVGLIAAHNRLAARAPLHVGQRLSVPALAPATASTASTNRAGTRTTAPSTTTWRTTTRKGTHVVRDGETLTGIAAKHRMDLTALARLNGLRLTQPIITGQRLTVVTTTRTPVRSGDRAVAAKPSTGRVRTVTHTVRTGETLSQIAQKHRVPLAGLLKANRLTLRSVLHTGDRLVVRVAATTVAKKATAAVQGRGYPSATLQAAERNRAALAQSRVPTRSQTRDLIVETARRHGVDPALALAIGWQESGWNQHAVSHANAIGVMQVIPDAGQWASTLVGRRLDLRDTRDNVTAGVVILRALGRMADSRDEAIASYYQGFTAVRTKGLYPDTKQYVRNVNALRKRF